MTRAEAQSRHLTIARLLVLALIVAFVALFPRARPDAPSLQGFVGGFLHPIEGFDHRLAMVAVGMWGAALGRPLIWTLPIAFPLVMAVGGSMGMHHMPFPSVIVEHLAADIRAYVGAFVTRQDAPEPATLVSTASSLADPRNIAGGTQLRPEDDTMARRQPQRRRATASWSMRPSRRAASRRSRTATRRMRCERQR